MTASLRDARFAFRQLRKSPWFTLAAVSMLALGICANGTVFSWINATLLHPIPGARNSGELVTVMRGSWNTSPSPPLSYPDYRDLRERNHSFGGILAYHADWVTLTGGDVPQRIYAANASANYFDVLGIKPYLGRFFRPDEEASDGGSPYLILGYTLWQTRFDADPGIIGKSVEINQHTLTVIGVAPKGFIGCMTGVRTDAWVPLSPIRQSGVNWQIEGRDRPWLNVTGRLRPGVNRALATQDLELLMQQLVGEYPDDHPGVNTIFLDPLWRSPFGANVYLASSLPILLAIAGVVLLLTCANIATLMLVRFVARRREIAIRQSLGANRIQLTRQMILEGMMLSLGAGGIAVLLTAWSSKTMARFIPPNSSPLAINGYLDWNVVGAIMVLAILASLLCGAMPAWRSSHVSPAEVLKDEAGSVSSGRSNQFLLSGLVVAQIALSLTLMVTAGLFMRTLRNTSEADPGFDRSHVLLTSVDLETAGYSWAAGKTFERNLLAKLQVLPGVESAAVSDWVPLSFTRGSVDALPEGYTPKTHESMEVRNASVSPDYFQTMKIPVLQGRHFTLQDGEDAPKVAIVDETMANHFWPGQYPLGKRMRMYNNWFMVVGVVKNTVHQNMNEAPEPLVYLSYFQFSGPQVIFHLRTRGNPELLAAPVEQAVHEMDSRLPVFDVRTLEQSTQIASMFAMIEATFASAFGFLALILAASGIYGVMAYRTQLRTHEIGIRVALGASRPDVLGLVLKQGLRLAAYGVILGLTMSLLLTRLLHGLLFGVSAMDPLTILAVVALLFLIAIAASYLPALKAMKTDPVAAIRAH
jgi:predicted permease